VDEGTEGWGGVTEGRPRVRVNGVVGDAQRDLTGWVSLSLLPSLSFSLSLVLSRSLSLSLSRARALISFSSLPHSLPPSLPSSLPP
jgi:hypothetical protein